MNINIIDALQQQWQLIAIYFLLFLLLIAIMAHDVFHLNDSTIEMWTGICFCFHFQSRIKQIICFTCFKQKPYVSNEFHVFGWSSIFVHSACELHVDSRKNNKVSISVWFSLQELSLLVSLFFVSIDERRTLLHARWIIND